MPRNELGNYLRERRMELGLSQEELAERIGGSASQAEISRLERGHVMLPRRGRMEALAEALEVTLGSLLVRSGWLTEGEEDDLDALPRTEESLARAEVAKIAVELHDLREFLLTSLGQVSQLEESLQRIVAPTVRSEIHLPAGVFDDWESSTVFVD
jgi:transcriptional regulator with XRE-family HTH domain